MAASSTAGRRPAVIVGSVVGLFLVVSAVLIFGSQGPPTQPRLFALNVAGDAMTPNRLQAYDGDFLTLSVRADKPEEIHLHGYDKHFFPRPGQAATLSFPAQLSGTFVIEIEATGTALGLLQVQPRGGFLGLGKPPDKSNTTIHKPGAGTLVEIGATASFNLAVEIGGIQAMYTPAQAASAHPRTGEVMFQGQMVMPPGMTSSSLDMGNMPGMNISPSWHHLEVHIFDKKSGGVVRTASPQITVTSQATGRSQVVPITTMQGVVEGASDFHYGNNVDLPAGTYVVAVVVDNENASFTFTV